MITNLVGNAIKFTEEGQVEVLVEEKSEGRLLISVADSGIGIPEDLEQFLENFPGNNDDQELWWYRFGAEHQ